MHASVKNDLLSADFLRIFNNTSRERGDERERFKRLKSEHAEGVREGEGR